MVGVKDLQDNGMDKFEHEQLMIPRPGLVRLAMVVLGSTNENGVQAVLPLSIKVSGDPDGAAVQSVRSPVSRAAPRRQRAGTMNDARCLPEPSPVVGTGFGQ